MLTSIAEMFIVGGRTDSYMTICWQIVVPRIGSEFLKEKILSIVTELLMILNSEWNIET